MMDESDVLSDLDQLRSRYEVLRQLGSDDGCVVYAVRGRGTDHHYLVKVMEKPEGRRGRPGWLNIWQGHTVHGLTHPRLMGIHAVHHLQGGAVAVAMERRRGQTLADRMRSSDPVPIAEAERILRDIADALGYLHERGVVHRDIRPETIFLDRDLGYARLAPFGLPTNDSAGGSGFAPSSAFSRLTYAAPEQLTRKGTLEERRSSPQSDLYSLGLVCWAMLAGGDPWQAATRDDLLAMRRDGGPASLSAIRSDVPAYLQAGIDACIERRAKRRCTDVGDLLAVLDTGDTVGSSETDSAGTAGARDRLSSLAATLASLPRPRVSFVQRAVALPRRDQLGSAIAGAVVMLVAVTLLHTVEGGEVASTDVNPPARETASPALPQLTESVLLEDPTPEEDVDAVIQGEARPKTDAEPSFTRQVPEPDRKASAGAREAPRSRPGVPNFRGSREPSLSRGLVLLGEPVNRR